MIAATLSVPDFWLGLVVGVVLGFVAALGIGVVVGGSRAPE